MGIFSSFYSTDIRAEEGNNQTTKYGLFNQKTKTPYV